MFPKKSARSILFPVVGSLTGIFLLSVFFIAAQNIISTFKVADMSALNNLQPQPGNYFLKLYGRQETPDKSKMYCYVDYYKHLLEVFPNLGDAYGMLGYCYHYLNNDAEAIKFLRIATQQYPDYFWNYYNLAVIYINESRYQEASSILQTAMDLDPKSGLKAVFNSQMVYLPIFEPDIKQSFEYAIKHLKQMYQMSFILEKILNQAGSDKKVQETMSKIKLELYAF